MAAFIVGLPRSGTSLLQNCLDQHSKICAIGETRFFLETYAYRNLTKPAKNLVKNFKYSGDPTVKSFYHFAKDDINLDALPAYSGFSEVCNRYAKHKGKSVWIEKTPLHLLTITPILKSTNAKIILIERDLPSILRSISQRQNLNITSDLVQCYARILNKEMIKYKNNPNLHVTKYEELVQNPRTELTKICNFLGVNFENSMLNPKFNNSSKNIENFRKSGTYNTVGTGISQVHQVEKPIYTASREINYLLYLRLILKIGLTKYGLNIFTLIACRKREKQ